MRRGVLVVTTTAFFLLAVAGPSGAKPPRGSGGYRLVENAEIVHPGKDSPTAARTISTGNPFNLGHG
jgi:hypothetical protein